MRFWCHCQYPFYEKVESEWDSAVVGIVGKSKSFDFSIMLVNTWNQNQNFTDFTVLHKQKNRQYLLTVRPFQFGLSFLFYCCIIFFVQWADFPNHRLCPDWLQDMFLTYCLNSKNHYLPFLTLRHDVANFLFWICFIPAPYKIHFTTPCRKLFCMLQNLPFVIMS